MAAQASEEMDLEHAEIAAVSTYIARHLTAASALSFGAITLSTMSFIVSLVFSLIGAVSRRVLVAGLGLTALFALASLLQLRILSAYGDELRYVSRPSTEEDEAEEPPPEPREITREGPGEPIRVSGDIAPPRKIRNVSPVYPPNAIEARVAGRVVLEAIIDPEGNVTNVRVLESIPLLDQAAMDAVAQWKYEPTELNGVAVPIVMTVTVNFALN